MRARPAARRSGAPARRCARVRCNAEQSRQQGARRLLRLAADRLPPAPRMCAAIILRTAHSTAEPRKPPCSTASALAPAGTSLLPSTLCMARSSGRRASSSSAPDSHSCNACGSTGPAAPASVSAAAPSACGSRGAFHMPASQLDVPGLPKGFACQRAKTFWQVFRAAGTRLSPTGEPRRATARRRTLRGARSMPTVSPSSVLARSAPFLFLGDEFRFEAPEPMGP